MKDRVIGIENEYAFLKKEGADPRTRLGNDDVFTSARRQGIFNAGNRSRWWLRTGGCAYLDQDKLEYASPECRRIRDVVAYNKAAEQHVLALTQGASGEQLFDLYKTNVAPYRRDAFADANDPYASFGCHENYLVYGLPAPDDAVTTYAYRQLLPFLTTRQIYGGSGWWPDPKENVFWRSQRAYFMKSVSSSLATTSARSILNERNVRLTPLVGQGRYHIVMGDANMLEYALYLKIGATSLVLAMMEDQRLPMMSLFSTSEDYDNDGGPVRVFRAVARQSDLTQKTIWMRVFGESTTQNVSPLELQTQLCEKAHEFVAQTQFDSQESEHEAREICRMWRETLTALHTNDHEFLYGRIDWYTKRCIAEMGIRQGGAREAEEIRADTDVLYHEISEGSMYEEMVRQGVAERIVTDDEIARALQSGPPPTPTRGTRASVRSRVVCDALSTESGDSTARTAAPDWNDVSYPADKIHAVEGMSSFMDRSVIQLHDPLCYESEVYDRFIKSNT